MKDNSYVVSLTPEEFEWMLDDVNLSLRSAENGFHLIDESGKMQDLTDYNLIKFWKGIKIAFKNAKKIKKAS